MTAAMTRERGRAMAGGEYVFGDDAAALAMRSPGHVSPERLHPNLMRAVG